VSDRNTDAWVGTLGRAGRVPESTTRVAIAHAASAMTEMIAAIAAK
jgi:hypothetical protein